MCQYKGSDPKAWYNRTRRSDRAGAPVLICPARRPTTMSEIVTSSVSPERCDTITPDTYQHSCPLSAAYPEVHSRTSIPRWYLKRGGKTGQYVPQPAPKASFAAWMDSVRVPIWLTLSSRALQALSSMAFLMNSGSGELSAYLVNNYRKETLTSDCQIVTTTSY